MLELIVYSYALGSGFLSLIILYLGLINKLYLINIIIITTSTSLIFIILKYILRENFKLINIKLRDILKIERLSDLIIFIPLIILYKNIFINIFLPLRRSDGINTYTALAANFANKHSIYLIEELYPYNAVNPLIPALYSFCYLLYPNSYGDPTKIALNYGVNSLSPITSVFILFALFLFAKNITYNKLNRYAPFLITLIFSLIPVYVYYTMFTGTEMHFLLFIILSYLSLFNYLEKKEKRYLILLGIINGFNLLTRRNGIVFSIILFILIFLNKLNNSKFKNIISDLSIYSFFSLIISSIWYMRNYIIYGNPIYPQMASLFPLSNIYPSLYIYNIIMSFYSSSPFEIFNFNYMMKDGSGLTFPIGLLFVILTFKNIIKDPKRKSLLISILLYFIIWYFFEFRTAAWRHLLPILPFLSVFYLDFLFCCLNRVSNIFKDLNILTLKPHILINNKKLLINDYLKVAFLLLIILSSSRYSFNKAKFGKFGEIGYTKLKSEGLRSMQWRYEAVFYIREELNENNVIYTPGLYMGHMTGIKTVHEYSPSLKDVYSNISKSELVTLLKLNNITHLYIEYWFGPSYNAYYFSAIGRYIDDETIFRKIADFKRCSIYELVDFPSANKFNVAYARDRYS